MFAGMDSVRTISQCTACSNLHISLPGKEMDRVEVVSVRPSVRPSVSSFQRGTMSGSRAPRPSTHTAELALGGMGWRGALMSQASFRLALHFT